MKRTIVNPIIKDSVTFLQTAEESGGKVTEADITLMPKGENPLDVDFKRAQELIDEKAIADAPIAAYKGEGVQKGTGRFGPFIKWNGIFINVSKKYNFDNLSQSDIEALIEDKLQKNIDKVLHNWVEEGILVEKARWGRSVITKGKIM